MTDIWDLRRKRKKFYDSIVSVYCPILTETVFFTSEGFNHLIYKRGRKPRNVNEQFMKLKCLIYAPDVIKNSPLINDTRRIKKVKKGKVKDAVQYELLYEVQAGKKVGIIVEKIGLGKTKFVSIMRYGKWRKSKKRP